MKLVMWGLSNCTPYGAGRNWVRDKNGDHHWVVAVRTTFLIGRDGALAVSEEQPGPALEPEYFGEPGLSSLRRDSDLLAIKPGTDVVLDACAHAPGGHPAASVTTSLRVDDRWKAVVVRGERGYYPTPAGLGITDPVRFLKRPIRYEMAYGGWDKSDPNPARQRLDARNPIGRGFASASSRLAGQYTPTIEHPDGGVSERGPVGYGPIDPAWSPRRELSGTYDEAWLEMRRPLLPVDYDERFALSAPADQQFTPHLRGGERIELVNLRRTGPLVFHLPRRYFTFRTSFGDRRVEHRARLTTVFIEPEVPQVSLVYQTALPVPPADLDYLDTTLIGEKEYIR